MEDVPEEAPYFFEALLDFSTRGLDVGTDVWRAERDAAMRAGREIYYCGRPPTPPPSGN